MQKSTVGILAGLAIAATSGLLIASKKGRKLSQVSLGEADNDKKSKKEKKENVGIIKLNR